MEDTTVYLVGTRVQVIHSVPGTISGSEGSIVEVFSDDADHITLLEVLIDSDVDHIHGTIVYPQEVVVLGK